MKPGPFEPTLPGLAVRLAIAAAGSLLVHALFISGAMRGLADVFRWSNTEPAPLTVTARIKALPAEPAVAPTVPRALPAKRKPGKPAAATPVAPLSQVVAAPLAAPDAPAPAVAALDAPAPAVAAPMAAPAVAGPVAETAPMAETAPSAPPQPVAPPPRPPRRASLPPQATITLELTLESNNYKVWATQQWSMSDGRYRIVLSAEARALFFTLGSIMLESQGVVSADGLRPERYVDERNKRRTTVSFSANEKSALVEEANGNRKTIALAGQAADIMSLTYDLAFNPDINVGAPFTLSNRDAVDEIRLVAKSEEVLSGEAGNLTTRFYDFRRPDGSGGIQVWLAPERAWLPAKIRVLGRDGALTMVATKYEFGGADSR